MNASIDLSDETFIRDLQRSVIFAAFEDEHYALQVLKKPESLWRIKEAVAGREAIRRVLADGDKPSLPAIAGHLRAMGEIDVIDALFAAGNLIVPYHEFRAALEQVHNWDRRLKRAQMLLAAVDRLNQTKNFSEWDDHLLSRAVEVRDQHDTVAGGTDRDIVRQEVELIRSGQDRTGFIDLGIPSLLKHSDGIGPGQLIVLCGHSGDGKTSLAMQWADYIAKHHSDVWFWSGEMSLRELARRRISFFAGKKFEELTEPDLDHALACSNVNDNLYYECEGGKLADFTEKFHTRIITHPKTNVVFVDYAGLLQDHGGGRETSSAGEVSDTLKTLAQRHQKIIFALWQPNRNVEGRTDKRPRKSDLRDSNKIVQDAHKIYFLHRPYNYDKSASPFVVQCHTLKDRNGRAGGFVTLKHSPSTFRFDEFTEEIASAAPKRIFRDNVTSIRRPPGPQPEWETVEDQLDDETLEQVNTGLETIL